MATPVLHPMDRRLSDAGVAFLATIPALSVYAKRGRDENTMVQEDGTPVAPILFAVAEDVGRTAKGMPIRNMRLGLRLLANAKAGGDKETVATIGGVLEHALDTTNLLTALSTADLVVMLATRVPGIAFRRHELLREWTVWLEVKAVARELTTES